MQRILAASLALTCATLAPAVAQDKNAPVEDDYYKLHRFDVPRGEVLECGGLDFLPDGKLAVGTRRGEIWLVDNATAADPKQAKFTRFAHGLHEILGLAARKDGWLYVTQRGEASRIKDTNGDGKADLFETVADGWDISGDYHEYALG